MIHVLPIDESARGLLEAPAERSEGSTDPLAWAARRRFMPSGRSALAAILESLRLAPEDDVFITNSSGQTYISPCVTSIVFNHCRPSRVLTAATRAIVVIHEFGYPHPELEQLLATARERGIPLIEDCAHSFDSTMDGVPLGSFGDFAIFSLTKVLPVRAGGVLVGHTDALDANSDAAAEASYVAYVPSMSTYSQRRRANYAAVRSRFPDLKVLLEAGEGVTPFHIGLLTPEATEVRRRSRAVEWGSTLRDDLLLVTTNPFVDPDDLVAALDSAFTLDAA